MVNTGKRIDSQKKTVDVMIRIYCKKKHHSSHGLCADCEELLGYAHKRLDYCRFGNDKGTCGKCPVHCYKPEMREKIQEVMRFAGPRMVYSHPIMAFQHLLDGMKKK